MKIPPSTAFLAAALLLSGCASSSGTKFTEYHGSEVFQGQEGAVRQVDGVDFWENGEPGRKYQILGLIEDSPRRRLPLGRVSRLFAGSGSGDRDSAVAKVAHERGGDAVIVVGGNPPPADDDDFGESRHRRPKKLVVVKYVE